MTAETAGSNDCIYMPKWTGNPVNCDWRTFGSGSITTGCGGAPAGDTFQGGEVFYMQQNTICTDGNSHDFLKYGRCDFNLYDEGGSFLNKALSAQVIPGTDPVMLKFVVPAEYAGTVWGQVKVKQLETGGVGHNETNKGAIPKDGKNYLINGNTMEWGTYVEPVPYTGNLYLIGGACTGQNWSLGNAVLLDNDGHGIYTITHQINAVTGDNSDGFKFLESANWAPQWRPTPENATVSLSDGGKAQDVAPGQTNIVIKKNPGDPDTKWHLTTSGTYTITIDLSNKDNGKMSIEAATPAEPDPKPVLPKGSFYLFGAGGTNWLTGWSSSIKDSYRMDVADGVATKTMYNVSGSCRFKIRNYANGQKDGKFTDYTNSFITPYEDPSQIITKLWKDGETNIAFNLKGSADVTVHFDGGRIWLTAVEHVEPATTYTVTLHPNNGGSEIVRTNVPEGSNSSAAELNLAAVTYGLGTATWYTNEACTEPFTSVTSDMHLYAKWGVSGNYWLVGDQWMYDTGSTWNNGDNPAFTTTDGVATVTFIAPMGRNRFEIIKDNNWGQKINNGSYAAVVNSASPVAISVADGHMEFTLDEMKKVTIIYDGKVSVRAEAYDIHKTGWNIAGNSGLVGQEWNNSACPMDNNGEKILRNINTGNYEFKITPVGSGGIAAVNQFSAANVDKDNSTSNIFRNWTSHLFGSYKDGNEYKLPMNNKKDRYVCIQLTNDMAINGKADIKIAFDGAKITVNVLPKYTVTFNSNGGNEVASQTMFEGQTATEPADPTKAGYIFSKWQLNGSDYNFSNPVTKDITLDAVWAYKPIESVSLNESTHMTWVDNSDFELTPTLAPSDLIAKSVAWSSDNSSIATVSDGTVHAVGEGTATITCTVTDKSGTQKTATCKVTVAACEMATDNIYSMTVTGYNTSTGSSATLSGLWNESTDNDGPASLTMYYLTITPLSGGKRYLYADESDHYVKRNTSNSSADNYYWIKEKVGKTGNNLDIYTIKNYGTGLYLASDDGTPITQNWYAHRAIVQADGTSNVAKWHYIDGCGAKLMNVAFSNGDNSYTTHETFLHVDLELGYGTINYHMNDESIVAVGSSDGCQNRQAHRPVFEGERVIDNPNYKASLMNGSYYRMNTDATVRANLNAALVKGAVITVRLYADAATSVKLQKTDGTDIETIDLSADTEREYSYTVASNSALLGENAFVIKATDNHAGIASIVVTRTYAANPSNPALTWETNLSGGVTQSALGGPFQHIASSTLSLGDIHYASSKEAVATVAEDGTVTPRSAGTTTIKATIEEEGCYGEAYITYNVTLTEPSLQEAIDAIPENGTLTLTHDYSGNAVINKAITINGGNYTIGDLTVEQTGDLTLGSESGLTVRDFTICAKAGNTSTPAASGQVHDAANLTCNGNAYFLYTVDPDGRVQYGWYDFTVPFPVNVMTGIAGIQNSSLNEDFVNERDYAIMDYDGAKQAQGQYPYKKFRGVMQPNQLYSITLDSRYNYNTVRFRKTADGDLVASNTVRLNEYTGSGAYDNWNGVGNGTLHHANIGVNTEFIQVYQSGDKTFLPVDRNQYSFVVGTAFMVQEAGTMTLRPATHENKLLAPARQASAPATAIQIAREGQPFSDQLFISASETGGQAYTLGTDLAKAGNIGNVSVPQIWTNAYNTKLCVHEAQLINGEASYNLSIYAPAADTYTLTSKNIPADYSLYLTQNGTMLTELNGTYTLDLNKGITTEYGLLLVETYKTPTGMEESGIRSQESGISKILHNGVLYILHNGKIYNAQGAKVK